MSEPFKQYKAKLRRKGTLRKNAGMEDPTACPNCGSDNTDFFINDMMRCKDCGHTWENPQHDDLYGSLDAIPEPYSPHGDRCPMCKNHRLIEMGTSLLCPECGWAGERFQQ